MLSGELAMEADKLRGVTFRQRRVKRGLSVREVAKMIDVSERAIIAYELGVDLQRCGYDFKLITELNSKWTEEELRTFKPKQGATVRHA